jgi:GMP synthase (glutamine-hydrolysing)
VDEPRRQGHGAAGGLRARRDRQLPHRRDGAREQPWFGIQFHPEVTHTLQGKRILERFVLEICGCEALWTPARIVEDAIARVRETVGDDHVLLGLSGGVDSSVVAALLHRAIGDQLTCVFVDNGLLRLHEGDQVMEMFARNMGVRVIRAMPGAVPLAPGRRRRSGAEAQDHRQYLHRGVRCEARVSRVQMAGPGHDLPGRHRVGRRQDRQGPRDQVPPQRRRPAGGHGAELVEPLRELFKDEVRQIGLELGLPHDMVFRHPFPGPGLGVRILGEVRKTYAELLRRADAIYIEELRAAGWYEKTSQAFAVFLPVKSVGVVGDARRYEYVVALRAVQTVDFMTARWAHLPYELLERVSNPHHQRDQRHLPRDLRHQWQAAGDDRVGVIPPGAMRAVTAKSPAPILPPRWRQRRSACHRRTSCATGRWDSMRGSCAPTWSSSEPSGC